MQNCHLFGFDYENYSIGRKRSNGNYSCFKLMFLKHLAVHFSFYVFLAIKYSGHHKQEALRSGEE